MDQNNMNSTFHIIQIISDAPVSLVKRLQKYFYHVAYFTS